MGGPEPRTDYARVRLARRLIEPLLFWDARGGFSRDSSRKFLGAGESFDAFILEVAGARRMPLGFLRDF